MITIINYRRQDRGDEIQIIILQTHARPGLIFFASI
jgi:hypothetical protein